MSTRFYAICGIVLLVLGLPRNVTASHPAEEIEGTWIPAWVSSQQLTEPHNLPPEPGLGGNTLRQVIQPKLRGSRLRIVMSNEYGTVPLTIGGVRVARSLCGATIEERSEVEIRFDGLPFTTLQPGTFAYSDPVAFEVEAFANLAIKAYLPAVPQEVTGHPGSRTSSYILEGEHLSSRAMEGAITTDHWYFLSSIEVWTKPGAAAVVVVGDSITDGRGSITNANNRWPDMLARRLQASPAHRHISVLNQGVGGGRMLRDGLGISALGRLDRDVLAQPGVRWLIVFIGVNDIGGSVDGKAPGQASSISTDLIAGMRQIITRAHNHGIAVIGATIMPFGGSFYDEPGREEQRQRFNNWIRTTKELDGVIDFDRITRDPAEPSRLSAAVDGGDHLHPSAEGYELMAEAIELELFSR